MGLQPKRNAAAARVRPPLPAPDEQAGHHHRTRRALQTAIAEDYVELIADLIERAGEARSVDIAKRLGVTHASVAKMVTRLKQAGLVEMQPYRAIFLTPKGRKIAAASKRRHDIVIAFLTAIGVPHEIASADAEGLEHHVSAETLACFERFVRGKMGPGGAH